MEKRNLTNKELDRIGVALLRASAATAEELEQVIDDRYLFASIKQRVRLEESSRTNAVSAWSGLFTLRSIASGLSVAVVVIAVFGLVSVKSLLSRQGTEVLKAPTSQPASMTAVPLASDDDATVTEPKPAAPATAHRTYRAEQAVIRTRAPHNAYIEPAAEPAIDFPQMEFYPLPGTAPDQMAEGRIVRVDLPRASLVALGANLPPENENPTVKTDLLVGHDGVPRAIRIVE
jgi:hypothetical protein